jgi:hypothetical protein
VSAFLGAEMPLWLLLLLVALVAGAYLTCGLLVWNERRQEHRVHLARRRPRATGPARVDRHRTQETSS